jgi:hypothetical protein
MKKALEQSQIGRQKMAGIIQEIREVLERAKFCEIIDEGQVGIYLHMGVAVPRRVRLSGKELEDVVEEEKKVIQDCGGYKAFLPFRKSPQLPEGYGISKISGLPMHPKRYRTDKDLKPGFYLLWPLIDSIYTDHNQERAIFSKPDNMVIVPTSDNANVAIGFVMVQKIEDYYRAYSRGDDYEDLLRAQASSIVAKLSAGKSSQDWIKGDTYRDVAHQTLEKLRKFTNNRWGIGVSEFALNPIILNPNIVITSNINQQNALVLTPNKQSSNSSS